MLIFAFAGPFFLVAILGPVIAAAYLVVVLNRRPRA
jgi:hypothetical protein